mmetsp:Transcript_55053/g.163828  ORF Transcript_55053/g.163828 Transcript_55053/m.163828 type:complete len:272 (-) Transcript_55053:800-1615(-)
MKFSSAVFSAGTPPASLLMAQSKIFRSEQTATRRSPLCETARSFTRGPCHVCNTSPERAQRCKFLSTPAETKCRPSGIHAHAVTASECLANVCRHAPLPTSHSLISRSLPHVRMWLSSGLHATNESESVWPCSVAVWPIASGSLTSHSTTMLSLEADASSLPSCENLTNHTSSECFSSVWRQSRGMRSRDAETFSSSERRVYTAPGSSRHKHWFTCHEMACCSSVCSRFSGSKCDGGMCCCSSWSSSRRDSPAAPSQPERSRSSSALLHMR